MTAENPDADAADELQRPTAGYESPHEILRKLTIFSGVFAALAFVPVGLWFQFQLYGDGAIFAYMIAAQDAWTFHWHNIAGRVFVYLYATVPAEMYAGLTGDARGAIALYGFLFYLAPLLGLIATYAVDRTGRRAIFGFACASTAVLCPMIFAFPAEIWVAHSLFWPALAICHCARRSIGGFVLRFAVLLALMLTHLGAMIFVVAILASLLMRGTRDASFWQAAGAFCAALAVWAVVVISFPPDSYFVAVLVRAALHVFDKNILFGPLATLLGMSLIGYGAAFAVLRKFDASCAHVYAALLVAAGLVADWLLAGGEIHAEGRYYLRTALIVFTPVFGVFAAFVIFAPATWLVGWLAFLPRLRTALSGATAARAAQGVLALIVLIHAVETARFAVAWTKYKAAVVQLSASALSDPELGDPRFVSSARIDERLQPLGWDSTTPYLSVLLAPRFNPARLVVNPAPSYFWLPCGRATANANAQRALPPTGRELIRVYSCLHRK